MSLKSRLRRPLVAAGLWEPRNARMPSLAASDRVPPLEAGSRVTIRADTTLLVDGEPFFPMGVYYARDQIADATGEGLRAIRRMGFNTIFFSGGLGDEPLLDRIWAAGLRVWCRPPGALTRDFRQLKDIAGRFARHPALLLWELDDEPVLNGVDIAAVRRGCHVVRSIDPHHPILCTQWYSGEESEDLAAWFDVADVHAFSAYPVPLTRWGTRMALVEQGWPHSIAVVGRQTALWRSRAPGKPVVPVLQAWAWNSLEDGEAGYPSAQEARFMAYHAIVCGAKGLHHYGAPLPEGPHLACAIPPKIHDDLGRTHDDFIRAQALNARFWRYYAGVVEELAGMSPVLTAEDAVTSPRAIRQVGGRSGSIEYRAKRLGNSTVLLVVNASSEPADVEIDAGLTSSGASATDRIEAWGVRVYR